LDLFGKELLLEQFLERVPDPQQDHGADERADDLAIPLGPEGTDRSDLSEQPATEPTAEKTDDDVPDQPPLSSTRRRPDSQPAMAPKSNVRRMLTMSMVFEVIS
jgi:hypothetical protein